MSDDKQQFDPELEEMRQLNDYQDFVSTFIDGFSTKLFHDGIINEVDMEKLQEYFSEPDKYQEVLSDLTEYFYTTSGEIHIMFELIESLPTLNYKIDVFDKTDKHDKYVSLINKALHKVKHKTLTRDSLKQTAASGTLVGIWLGGKNNLYPYIFENPSKVFPSYRLNGEWVVEYDLSQLDEFTDFYRNVIFENLSPYITKDIYENYRRRLDKGSQYVSLPQERTFVIQTHTLHRNQALGRGWANASLFDILHKRKMKNVERAIANKIINAIAVLTIGNEKSPEQFGSLKLNPKMKKKIHSGVKQALDKNTEDGISVVSIPEFAKLEFSDVKTDGLDGKKFEHLNSDINSSLGLSSAVTSGEGGNHASAKINIDTFYKRIGVLLESIESDMYQKMINLILPKSQKENYYMVYDKDQPLTRKEKIDSLMKLNDKGWSIKHVIDQISDVNWEAYLEQTIYETEELGLQERLKPYKSSHTTSGREGEGGSPIQDDVTDEGAATRDGDKNDM